MPLDFTFFLADGPPLAPGGPRWDRPLPADRSGGAGEPGHAFTVGDYFQAARAFLSGPDAVPVLALSGKEPRESLPVSVRLEKHGAFYHPARVTVPGKETDRHFVLNLAVSDAGLSAIENEFQALSDLCNGAGAGIVPEVHCFGRINQCSQYGRETAMFLGEWFDGFHEFHLTRGPEGETGIVAWTPEGPLRLTPSQIRCLYRKTARAMTVLLDTRDMREVGPWRHAAGDFVVRPNGDGVDVRLITVRGRRPIFAEPPDPETDPAGFLEALLFFLARLSILNRLDRIDGVKDPELAGPEAVFETVAGFLAGVDEKPSIVADASLAPCILAYAAMPGQADLLPLCREAAESLGLSPDEAAIVERALSGHAALLREALSG